MPLARGHYENFPVASILLPPSMRPHISAVYAFARAADDFADEGDRTVEERCRLLDGWMRRLRHAAGTSSPGWSPEIGEPPDVVDLFGALGTTIRERSLPLQLFEDLLSAFRQDVAVTRYVTWEQRARLLSPFRKPGRENRSANCRARRRSLRSVVRRDLHGSSADQFLARSQA